MKEQQHKQLGRVPLERAFSKLGLASRSQARQWILEGRVRVDKKVIRDPLVLVTPERVRLEVDGKTFGKKTWRTLLMNKPKGVVTTRSDEKGRPTVFSLLKEEDAYLHPVGRLDMATTGLLLLTNDTQLSDWLTDPRNNIIRVYLVTVDGLCTDREVEILSKGIKDGDEFLKPQKVTLRKSSSKESHLTVELTEGKNREIRRMFGALRFEVASLKRVAFGGLELKGLPSGEYREVSREELALIFPAVPFKKF